jgi:hypothetical protein
MAHKHLTDFMAGVIDNDYRSNIKVLLHNHGHEPLYIRKGDHIAQFIVINISTPTCTQVHKTQAWHHWLHWKRFWKYWPNRHYTYYTQHLRHTRPAIWHVPYTRPIWLSPTNFHGSQRWQSYSRHDATTLWQPEQTTTSTHDTMHTRQLQIKMEEYIM